MYKPIRPIETTIVINDSTIGQTIESFVERLMNNSEELNETLERNYTERKDGVIPEFNIRTDRFELAVEATDKITASKIATGLSTAEIETEPETEETEPETGKDTSV